MPFPAWSACTVHVPALTSEIVAPFVPPVVHTEGVVDVNDTVSPDEAVADTVTGDCTMVLFASVPNEIVCAFFDTTKLCGTAGAAL